jgi:hypothetical protein
MRQLKRVFQILSISVLAAACAPVQNSPNWPASPQPPTEAPLATANPQATSTAAVPEGFYATQQADSQATIVARATAFPFPTALPGIVVQGQPARALGRRDGLSLEVRLSKDAYLAGEGGLAEVEIRNEGPETVFIEGNGHELASLALIDEQSQQPEAWPFSFARYSSGPPYLGKLEPGDVLTKTLQFQIPPFEQNPPTLYNLWAETHFSRPAPDNPQGPDNLWLRLEAGPVQLSINPPDPSNYLDVDWQADRSGWRLSVKNAKGQVPPGPFWGEIGAASPNSLCAGPLRGAQPEAGEWAGSWEDYSFEQSSQVFAGGWIAVGGYVTSVFSQTLPGEGDAGRMLGLSLPGPKQENYTTLKAAQATLDFPIFALAPHLNGSTLEKVQIERRSGEDGGSTSIEQHVELPGGAWIVLVQMVTSASYASAGWGLARYDFEARQVDIHGQTGYAIQYFGWWYLDWKVGEMGLELRAPLALFSLEDLLKIASRLGG